MREKEAYSRPEMEVLRFGDRRVTTTGSSCENDEQLPAKFKITLRTFGSDADGGSYNGCGFDVRLPSCFGVEPF